MKKLFKVLFVFLLPYIFYSNVLASGNDAYTVLLLHNNGTDASTIFTDSSLNPHAMTAVDNAQIDTAQSKFGGASGLFDGTSDSVTALDSDDWSMESGPFTMDMWIMFNDLTARQFFIVQRADTQNYWFIDKNTASGGNQLRMGWLSENVVKGYYVMTNSWTPNTEEWYHLEFARDVSNNGYIFIDGVSQDLTVNTAFGTNDLGNVAAELNVGIFPTSSGINGWMDEVRISKGICRHTTNFTPKTSEYDQSVDDNLQIIIIE